MAIVHLFLKHDDRAVISMDDIERDGYLPYVNAVIGGDQTSIEIDNETGKIIGWSPIKIENGKFVEEHFPHSG
jgi:hypothetical protein